MTIAQRLLSLSILGIMALTLAPAASAAGLGIGMGVGLQGSFDGPLGDIDAETRAEIKVKLDVCRDQNTTDETRRECKEAVLSAYGVERVTATQEKPGVRARIGHKFRNKIEEKCGEREDTDTWRECAKNARGNVRNAFREHQLVRRISRRHIDAGVSAELRAELKACREKENALERRTCILDVTAKIRAAMKAQAKSE